MLHRGPIRVRRRLRGRDRRVCLGEGLRRMRLLLLWGAGAGGAHLLPGRARVGPIAGHLQLARPGALLSLRPLQDHPAVGKYHWNAVFSS